MVNSQVFINLRKFCKRRNKQKIKENLNKPLEKSTVGFDERILYPINPDGTKTGGTAYGMVDYYDEQNDW